MESNRLIQGQEANGPKPEANNLITAKPKEVEPNIGMPTPVVKARDQVVERKPMKPKLQPKTQGGSTGGQKKGIFSVTSILLVLGIIGLVIYSVILLLGNSTLAEDKINLEVKLDSLRQVEETGEAKATLSTRALFYREHDESRILWTNIINNLMGAVPKSVSAEARAATILNVIGNDQGTLTIAMESHPDSQEPFFDTAILLKTLAEQNYLADVFIPSIGVRQNQLGQVQLSYTVNAKLLFDEVNPSLLDDEDLFSNGSTPNTPEIIDPKADEALAAQVEALRGLATTDESSVTPDENE